jgi:hypothetical protein
MVSRLRVLSRRRQTRQIPLPTTTEKDFRIVRPRSLRFFDYTLTFVSAQCPGSTHDSVAFAASGLARLLAGFTDETLPSGYWIAAEDANCCRDRLLTPWPGRVLSPDKDCFNYWQSSARICIEQAFGMSVGRWGIF